MTDLPYHLERVVSIARRAGRAVEDVRRGDADVEHKEDGSPVTAADRASHRVIVEALPEMTPEIPVVSEEAPLPTPSPARQGEELRFWLVDPLDGTKEFIKGLPEYTVNIALVEGGRPVLGVIHVPPVGLTYWAAEGLGAWKQEGEDEPQRIRAGGGGEPHVGVVSRSHASLEVRELLSELGVTEVIRCGSSLKMCAVAEGSADVYARLGPTWPWDTAAGAAVAEAAGCQVRDPMGRPLSYSHPAEKHHGFVVYHPGSDVGKGVEQRWEEGGSLP